MFRRSFLQAVLSSPGLAFARPFRYGAPLNLVTEGDSIPFGRTAPPGRDFPSQLARLLGADCVRPYAVSGSTLTHDLVEREPMVDLARREGAINVLVVLAGSNDLTLGADPIALAGAMNAYVARRTGFITAVLPLLPRDFPGFESKRLAFNASLSGLVVNLDALNDPAYYVDGIHPNEAGFSIIAERVAETLLPLLRSSS